MYTDKIAGKIPFTIEDNGTMTIGGRPLDSKETAFFSYYLIRKSDAKNVISVIEARVKGLEEDAGLIDVALWVWVIGEYTNITKDKSLFEKYDVTIYRYLEYLATNWNVPQKNWLGLMGEDVYISNIAMVFAAAGSIGNITENSLAQKLRKQIRDFLFKKLLVQGKVVSGLINKEPMGDITIIAVPFALMDAGNQILVESMRTVESELVKGGVRLSLSDMYYGGCERNDLSCLLSWYYSEKGDISRAKSLLAQVKSVWEKTGVLNEVVTGTAREQVFYDVDIKKSEVSQSNIAYIFYAMAELNIAEKESGQNTSGDTVQIIHNPEGTGNKYMCETIQRVPVYPIENESVFIRMITQPLHLVKEVYLSYTVNGIEQSKIRMELETSNNDEQFWQANIGNLRFAETVKYCFEVITQDETVASSSFDFIVRKWVPIGKQVCVQEKEDSILLSFPALVRDGRQPTLEISAVDERETKFAFFMNEDNPKGDMSSTLSKKFEFDGNCVDIELVDGVLCVGIGDDVVRSYKNNAITFAELLTDGSGTVSKVRYNTEISSGEKFFGMGERFSEIEYGGNDIDNYVYNEYTNQQLRTYIPVPFAVSSKGYSVFAHTTMYSVFRFGTRMDDLLEIEVDIAKQDQALNTYVFVGSPKESIQSFAKATGKPVLPPKWAFGPWMSSNNWDTQDETIKQADLNEKYKIPSTVLVLEQWSDEATYYIFNDAKYEVKNGKEAFGYNDFSFPEWGRWPDPKAMVKELQDRGLKVLLWQMPSQKYMDGIAHAQRDEDERVMLEEEYHIKRADGKPYRIPVYEWFKRSVVPDFTNPKAKEWWLGKRRYLLDDIKIDGFKTDGGECIYGEDLLFYDGRTGEQMRNQFPNEYVQSFYDFAKEHRNGDAVTFSRAGYTGAQAMPMHWAGDEFSTYDAYRASVKAGISCSISGIPFWGWDIGGFHGEIPTADLYIRSTQFAAFCPVMQYHAETKGEQNRDRTPWNIAERTNKPYVISLYKKFADLRMNILPYIYEQAKLTSSTGIPMMRAMFLEYPYDESCIGMSGQYFFGDSLLVAPVIEENAGIKDVYLPEGEWVDFFEGAKHAGGKFMTVKSDIKNIPVYIKENSVIPLNLGDDLKLCSYVGNDVKEYKNLCLMMYVTDKLSYNLSDELGNVIDVDASATKDGLSISVSGSLKTDVTLIIKDPMSKYCSVYKNSKKLVLCEDKCTADAFWMREKELLIRIEKGKKEKILCS